VSMVDALRNDSLRERVSRAPAFTPPCTKCKYCMVQTTKPPFDKVSLLCYNDGSDGDSDKPVPTDIPLDVFKEGFCRGFVYRSTRIDNDMWEAYLGTL